MKIPKRIQPLAEEELVDAGIEVGDRPADVGAVLHEIELARKEEEERLLTGM